MKQEPAFIPPSTPKAVTTERQIVVAAELTTEGDDFQQLEPMIAFAQRELRRAGVTDRSGVVLADAGWQGTGGRPLRMALIAATANLLRLHRHSLQAAGAGAAPAQSDPLRGPRGALTRPSLRDSLRAGRKLEPV